MSDTATKPTTKIILRKRAPKPADPEQQRELYDRVYCVLRMFEELCVDHPAAAAVKSQIDMTAAALVACQETLGEKFGIH